MADSRAKAENTQGNAGSPGAPKSKGSIKQNEHMNNNGGVTS